ncbi:MAG: hypothetical protein J0H68_00750 [Sphingobacteriia bacterium]|nr:hypothetical protein [Sphingobacteriia bacterium]
MNLSLNSYAQTSDQNILVFPNENIQSIINLIDSAKKSVDITVYKINDKRIVKALKSAKQRGVGIRVILQKPGLYAEPFAITKNYDVEKSLKEFNVPVSYLEDHKYILTHYKFIIIDKNLALINTFNFDENHFHKTRDFSVKINDKEKVLALQEIFENDFFGKTFLNDGKSKYLYEKFNLILGPKFQRQYITDLIKSAKKSIYIYQQDFTDPVIAKVIREMAKNGVKVNVIMSPVPFGGTDFNRINQIQIKEAGGEFRFSPKNKLYIHTKIIIIDPESNDGKVYLGSCNFWTQALEVQRELGIIVKDSTQIRKIFNVFKKDWTSSTTYEEALKIENSGIN